MSDPNDIRLILSIRGWDSLREAYRNWDSDSVQRQLNARMRLDLDDLFRVVAYPSNIPIPDAIDISDDELRAFLVFGIVIRGGPTAARTFAMAVKNLGHDAGVGADLVVNPAHDPFWTHWCPNEAGHGLLGDRAWALRTIRADPPALRAAGFPGPEQVNLVFLDTGLPLDLLPADNFKGWSVLEDSTRPGGAVRRPGNPLTYHGEMVARNAQAVALAAAPSARIKLLDCPAIPDGIKRLPVFLHTVAAALFSILATIVTAPRKADGWVICNAWGVFDPTVKPGQVPYSDNPLHPVAIALKLLNLMGADLVFAAGNCGQFCPNPRCSPAFTGPSRSINGANALREVLTVGAVRADKVWLGYSGQGPGIARMAKEKPDICAPSQFASDDYPGHNTGSSAACGLAAGAVALLRTRWQPSTLTTEQLRGAIKRHAVQPYGPVGWQERTGHGILDLAATAEALNRRERSAVRPKRR
ncbi:hypothetical protein ASG72_11830 [Bosea sp. Leaf344]|uniref:S8 family serine peptidase n=1 Tax=Bosea sp. Leaf344 TaxID=1736346 RepID=UPI000700E4BF|nr:S8 family serine peptidase [Bosea sp. Leaf344]KQU50569.1 hypothetical protein ASG72_11830 [Bosea sp. Leaf344]